MSEARIIVLEGEHLGSVFELQEGIQTIGRSENMADIAISDKSISHVHATLEVRDDVLYVIDKDSTNGLFYNRQKVRQAHIHNQQFFAVGDIHFRFEAGTELHDVISDFQLKVSGVLDELRRKIVGQENVLKQLLVCVFAGGHSLMVGVPGLAKTVIVNSMAEVLDLEFKRIQFTPDLMPSDILGNHILQTNDEGQKKFVYEKGPVFTQLLLADEINRTPPKTQAALLEGMQEKQITYGQESLALPEPFIVFATQNPIEQEGTYLLPEAQLDRFMFNILVDYPSVGEEEEILRRTTQKQEMPLKKIMKAEDIIHFQNAIKQVEVSPYVIAYTAKLVRATRLNGEDKVDEVVELLEWGAGPRAGQYLIWGAKVLAAMDGRLYTTCDDVRSCVYPVLRHRISPNFQSQAKGISVDEIITKLLGLVKEPSIKG